jgi:hypothetical protein
MQKLFNFLMIGLTFAVLNVATVAAQAEVNPLESNTGPGQQGEMSEFVDATDGSPSLSAGDSAGAAVDEAVLAAARAADRAKEKCLADPSNSQKKSQCDSVEFLKMYMPGGAMGD